MYIWKNKSRLDRRGGQESGLKTLPPQDLALLREEETELRAQEERTRLEMEGIEIDKLKNFVKEELNSYFETRNGKDEISAVGALMIEDRVKGENANKNKKDEDGDDDESEHSGLSAAALAKASASHSKKKDAEAKKEAEEATKREAEELEEGEGEGEKKKKKKKKKKDKDASSSASSQEKVDPMSIDFILELPPKELNADQKAKLKVYHVFSMFDADAGGTMNAEELRHCIDELCIPMSDEELRGVMDDVDEDKSGEINFEEFYAWYQKNAAAAAKGKGFGAMALKFAKAMRNYNGESIREEAKRVIIATGEREAEERARRLFRMSRPPRFCCGYCGEAFQTAVELGVHEAKQKQIHEKFDHDREATLKRQHVVLDIINGPEARKWRVRRLIHSKHLYDPELDGINYDGVTVWKNKNRPFNSDPGDKRGDQLRNGQLVEGFDAKLGKRAGFVQRGFLLRDQRPGEGRTRNHMAHNPLLLPDVILRLYMDKQPHVTKSVRKRAKKKGIALPLDTLTNSFLCDPSTGQSKAMVSFHWSGLVYQGAFVHGEFNGHKGERMSSQGHVNSKGESEFVLERWLSPGFYHYYFVIDGRQRVDTSKPVVGKGHDRRNVITVCNPSVLGGQGGPYTDGRLTTKNLDAVAAYGGDISTLVDNSPVDMVKKFSRSSSRPVTKQSRHSYNSEALVSSRPDTTSGQHLLNSMQLPTHDGLSSTFLATGGKKMTTVHLVHNMVCDDGSWALAQALRDNHRVTDIDLSSNLITSDGLRNLSHTLEFNSSVLKLRINNNNIGYDGCRAFATALINNDELRLRELEIAKNSLGDDGAEAICRGLAGCGTLTYVNLDGNHIHDDGACSLGEMLRTNKVITQLNVSYNMIQGVGAKKLGEALTKNRSLKMLALQANPLGPDGLEAIASMLRQNDSLTTVKLGYCRVLSNAGVQGLFELCRCLRVNRTLTSLDLSGNDFAEADMRKLLASLHDLDNPSIWTRKRNWALHELRMEDNHFDGEWMMKDHEVNRNGFPTLPSIHLYCKQNRERWNTMDSESKNTMLTWLTSKRMKRKDNEAKKQQRKDALAARVAAAKEEASRKANPEYDPVAAALEAKRLRKAMKREAALKREGGIGPQKTNELTLEERQRIQSREAKLHGHPQLDDEASISSLGSEMDNLKVQTVGTADDASIVSSVTGGGSIQYLGGKYEDSSIVSNPSVLTNPNSIFSVPGASTDSLGPSIDSDFLMSLRGSLFGSSQGSSIASEEKKEESSLEKKRRKKSDAKFHKSGMYSITEDESLGASLSTVSMMSTDSESMLESDQTATTYSVSKNSAATFLIDKAEEDAKEEQQTTEDYDNNTVSSLASGTLVSFNFNKKPPLPPTGPKPEPRKKVYAREEGEWRKDRTWISQRSLDRTARKIAEEAARQEQIKRQFEEDSFIQERVEKKEEEMEKYFRKDDGVAMVQAVVDELKDLRKDENAKKEKELIEIRRQDVIKKTNFYPEAKLRHEVKSIFDIFDGDASGQIDVDEFGDLMKELCIPMPRKELKVLVKKLDSDKSGELDFEEFFEWYKDNHKEQKQTSFVEGLKLQAQSYVKGQLGSTAKMEAKRILISNETKDVVAIARHEFRQRNKPQFECMECHRAFIDKKRRKEHDKNIEELHEQYRLLHERARARHKLVDLARYRVTKGEVYPKYFVYPDDVADHIELQVMDRPDMEVGRPLGVVNKNTTVKALGRSGEKGTGDWLRVVYKNFEEAWIQEKSRRPLRLHLVPMPVGPDSDDVKEEKRKMRIALSGKSEAQLKKEEAEMKAKTGEDEEWEEIGEGDLVLDGEEVEEVEIDEQQPDGSFVKVKKRRRKKKKSEGLDPTKDEGGPKWPKLGHLEFFPLPRYYTISWKLPPGTELNVRAQPDLESPIVGHIINTMAVKCSATYGDWMQISFNSYDNAWMLIRNKVHDLLKPVDREAAERAAVSKLSPWDWTYDYVLDKPTELHITAGSRDALGAAAFDRRIAEKKSTSTKAMMGLQDQITEDL